MMRQAGRVCAYLDKFGAESLETGCYFEQLTSSCTIM